MSILFLNTLLLPLLALGTVPLLLHLFSRAKPPLYKFSSNEFLKKILKRTNRVRKPQDIILLILRTLLFIAVILMFLQPLLFPDSKLAGLTRKKNVVILLDASASMGYVEGGQTRFAAACAEASEILRGLSSGDRANVIYIKARPEAIFPAPGGNTGFLRTELRRARVSNEPGNVGAAVRKAVDMLAEMKDGISEICVISDFQKTQWENNLDLEIPDDIAVTFVKTGKERAKNLAVSGVSADPPSPLLGEDVRFSCEVRNFSPAPRRTTVYFRAGALHESTSILIPAWGSATPVFKGKKTEKSSGFAGFSKPGIYSYEFSVGEDEFADDNRRWGALKVEESLKIGIAGTSLYPGKYWRKALAVFPWAEVARVDISAVAPDEHFDFLMISGWNGENSAKLAEIIRNGTVVFVAPSNGIKLADFADLAPEKFNRAAAGTAVLEMEQPPGKKVFHMKISSPDEKCFAVFADGAYGDPAGGYVRKRLAPLPEKLFADSAELISYTDGPPALLRCSAVKEGRFFIWNIPLEPENSNFASRVQFVPFMAELILAARNTSGNIGYLAGYTPGEPLLKVIDFTGSVSNISLKSPEEKTIPLKTSANFAKKSGASNLSLVSSPVDKTGVYSWLYSGDVIDKSIVNFAAVESDMRTYRTDELRVHATAAYAGAGAVSRIHEGIRLWPYLLALALILALAEGAVMLWSEKE